MVTQHQKMTNNFSQFSKLNLLLLGIYPTTKMLFINFKSVS